MKVTRLPPQPNPKRPLIDGDIYAGKDLRRERIEREYTDELRHRAGLEPLDVAQAREAKQLAEDEAEWEALLNEAADEFAKLEAKFAWDALLASAPMETARVLVEVDEYAKWLEASYSLSKNSVE